MSRLFDFDFSFDFPLSVNRTFAGKAAVPKQAADTGKGLADKA